jgi:hypothetical protein
MMTLPRLFSKTLRESAGFASIGLDIGKVSHMRIYSIVGLCLALAACQEVTVAEKPVESCGAKEMSHLMGLQRAQLENIAFTQPHRILGPNDPMTNDYRLDRVNFRLDDSGTVVRIDCG